MVADAFGWRLRDPAPGEFRRLGHGEMWRPHEGAAGQPLLFVPGGYRGAWCYGGYLDTFAAAGVACAAAEPRGHGVLAGDELDPRAVLADYVADVAAAARHLVKIEDAAPVLVGHSLGALGAALAVFNAAKLARSGMERERLDAGRAAAAAGKRHP